MALRKMRIKRGKKKWEGVVGRWPSLLHDGRKEKNVLETTDCTTSAAMECSSGWVVMHQTVGKAIGTPEWAFWKPLWWLGGQPRLHFVLFEFLFLFVHAVYAQATSGSIRVNG